MPIFNQRNNKDDRGRREQKGKEIELPSIVGKSRVESSVFECEGRKKEIRREGELLYHNSKYNSTTKTRIISAATAQVKRSQPTLQTSLSLFIGAHLYLSYFGLRAREMKEISTQYT